MDSTPQPANARLAARKEEWRQWHAVSMARNPDPQPFEEFWVEPFDENGRHRKLQPKSTPDEEARIVEIFRKKEEEGKRFMAHFAVLNRLECRRFKNESRIAKPVPRFSINGRPVCTGGNLTTILAQAEAGKSSLVAAFDAAAISAETGNMEADTLGVTATPPGKKRFIHIDTEQSPYDADQLVLKILIRADAEEAPKWFLFYSLAGFSSTELVEALTSTMKEADYAGGVYAVVIDGVADMVADVNDARECNAFVADLHRLAIKSDCPILCVLHENPGSDSGKGRGHFGSQLARKSESNIRIQKSGEISVVYSEKMRGAPIFKNDGPRFAWSDQAGMHISVESAGQVRNDAKCEKLRDQAEAVFIAAGVSSLAWSAMRDGIAKSEGIGNSGASKRFDAMRALGVITKNEIGHWSLAPSTPRHPDNIP